MRYLWAIGLGLLTAIGTAILWVVVSFVLPLALPFLFRTDATRSGSASVGAMIGSGSILLAALLGFVAGLMWMLWRRQKATKPLQRDSPDSARSERP
jgi:hypothetical protein